MSEAAESTDARSAAGGEAWLRARLLPLAVGLTLARLLAAGKIHLTEDEAYYRLWAQHLQFGYFDHPPMIAWWIRAGMTVAGDTPLGVRLLPALASGIATLLVGDLARRLGLAPRTAFRAAVWYNATLTICVGGMIATPDAPASLFWIATLWLLAAAWTRERAGWWLGAGVAAGLAVLSKYSALFLAPGAVLWLAIVPGGLARLKRPGPWLACVAAGALFAVNVVWNAQNHWESFEKQFGRVAPEGFAPGHLAEFLGAQVLLLTPLIAVFAGIGIWRAWRARKAEGGALLMLPVATAAPFALYLMIHSLHDRVQAHWPAPLFGALAICAAAAAPRSDSQKAAAARWFAPAIGFALGAAILVILALPLGPIFGPHDPTMALRGWPKFAADIEDLRRRHGAAWVGTESYGVFSQLEAEGAITTPLLEVVERDRYRRDEGLAPDLSRDGLIVDLSRRMKVQDVGRCFRSVAPVAELGRAGGGGKNLRYTAYLVSGPKREVWFRGCPEEIRPGVWK